jgi:hypothetical protein
VRPLGCPICYNPVSPFAAYPGRLKPEIGELMLLKDAPKAQQLLLDYKVQEKVVLVSG